MPGPHAGTMPSTFLRKEYGNTTAVSAMSNAQLSQFYFWDTSVGAVPNITPANGQNGFKAKLADGRLDSDDWQTVEDAAYCRKQLGLGNGD